MSTLVTGFHGRVGAWVLKNPAKGALVNVEAEVEGAPERLLLAGRLDACELA